MQNRIQISRAMNQKRIIISAILLVAGVCAGFSAKSDAASVVMFVADTDFDYDDISEIHLMRPNGTGHRRVMPRYPMLSASLSPKGTSIAYSRADKPELRVIGTDGKNDRRLAVLSKTTEDIAWSPNGRYIAYEELTLNSGLKRSISYYDIKEKKHIRTVPIAAALLAGSISNGITRLRWSPDSRRLAVNVTDLHLIPGFSADRFDAVYLVDVPRGVAKYLAGARLLGFLNNRRVLVKSQQLSLGAVQVNRPNRIEQLVDIGNGFDEATVVAGGKSVIVKYPYFFGGEFDINDTNLTSISGVSQGSRHRYDLLDVNLRTKAGKFITPRHSSFLPNRFRFRNMQWVKRTSRRTFTSDTCWGWVITKKGTNRRDRITGTAGSDVIHSRGGNDIVRGGGGNDVICGGPGNDRLYGLDGHDVILGDVEINVDFLADADRPSPKGKDLIHGGDGVDTVFAEGGRDRVFGGKGNDFISGGSGNDIIDGQGGDRDTANGNDDHDTCRNFETVSNCEQ